MCTPWRPSERPRSRTIAAFLALGVALVVLGFFYNRFADVLKKLFEGDEA